VRERERERERERPLMEGSEGRRAQVSKQLMLQALALTPRKE
jgi:hypothetical protein